MIPKIASALARILEPIKPVVPPGQSITLSKSADSSEGGYSPPGHQSPHESQEEEKEAATPGGGRPPDGLRHEGEIVDKTNTLPFRPGLTQVILDLTAHRAEKSAGAAAQSYETGAKEQKKNARLPKGSMLDKKVG